MIQFSPFPRKKRLIALIVAIFVMLVMVAISAIQEHRQKIKDEQGISQIFADEPVANKLPMVVTNTATDITANAATINAQLVATGEADSVTGGFVYEGNVTAIKTLTAPGPYSIRIEHLVCGHTYSYNAVATNSKGSWDGATRVFKTAECKAPAVPVKKK